MNRGLLLALLALTLLTLTWEFLHPDPGYLLLRINDWSLQARPVAVLVLVVLIWLGLRLLRQAVQQWRILSMRRQARHRNQAIKALLQRDGSLAQRELDQIADTEPLDEIGRALAAWYQGNAAKCRRALARCRALKPDWSQGLHQLEERLLSNPQQHLPMAAPGEKQPVD